MVLFVSSHAKRGGAENYLERLLDGLGPSFPAQLVTLESGPFALRVNSLVIETGPDVTDMIRSAIQLRTLARRERPDVIHANGLKAGLVSGLATLGTRIGVVWVKHDFSHDGWLATLVSVRARRVVSVSEALVEALPRRIRERKVSIIPTGIASTAIRDRVAARSQLEQLLGKSRPRWILAVIGRLHPVKGHGEILAIAPRLIREFPGLVVAFVGGEDSSVPSYRPQLVREIAKAGLEDSIVFVDHRSDLLEFAPGFDLVAIPSVRLGVDDGGEGFSLVALEMMSVGVPVVAYADGGLPEVVGDAGMLVRPGDRGGLQRAISDVLNNRDVRDELSRRGIERARTDFSVDRWVAAMRKVYAEAANGASSTP